MVESWSDAERRDQALERLADRLSRPDPLSRTELAILFLLSHGLAPTTIGEVLHMSRHTVHEHASIACLKLGARNKAQAVAVAYRRGLIS